MRMERKDAGRKGSRRVNGERAGRESIDGEGAKREESGGGRMNGQRRRM